MSVWTRYLLGVFLTVIVMVLVLVGLLAGFEWLGYPDPRTAPAVFRWIALLLYVLLLVLVFGFATRNSYDILQERRRRRRGQDRD